jgi:hypothetical protein
VPTPDNPHIPQRSTPPYHHRHTTRS